jgi:hypothetical protein
MLQQPTDCSGFTTRLDTPYNLLTVDPPRSMPLCGKSLRWSSGGLCWSWDHFAARLFAKTLSSSPPFGGTRMCLFPYSPLGLRTSFLQLRRSLRHAALLHVAQPSTIGDGRRWRPQQQPLGATAVPQSSCDPDSRASEATCSKRHPSNVRVRPFRVPAI